MTRSRSGPTSSSAAPTRSSTCCSARDIQRAYGQPEQVILTLPLLTGHRRRAQDVQVLRQPHRRHRGAGGDVRQDAERSPTRRWRTWYALLLGASARSGARPARRQARAGPGAGRRASTTRGRGAGGRGGTSTAVHIRHEVPGRVPEVRAGRVDGRRRCTCRRCWRRRSAISTSEARRASARARSGRRRAGRRRGRSTSPRRALDGRVLQFGKRRFARVRVVGSRCRRDGRQRRDAAARDAGQRHDRRPHRRAWSGSWPPPAWSAAWSRVRASARPWP